MHWLRTLCFVLTASVSCLASPAGDDDWMPVTPQDLQVKQVPGSPGAPAIQLFYAHRVDYSDGKGEFFYHRIKVLTEAGRKFGNVEVVEPFSMSVKDLKARVIRQDGSVAEFKDKPFEKTVFKGKGVKVKAKSLALPEVAVGSIIEYKYRLRGDEFYVYDTTWTVEHELFTVREQFSFKYSGNLSLAFVASPGLSRQPTVVKKGIAELELENVPAFHSEDHMPPEDNYKLHVRFFFSPETRSTVDRYWQDMGEKLGSYIQNFIGNHKEVRDVAAEAMGSETDPEKRLRRIYDRVQKVRNLSYERSRTEVEDEKNKIQKNENAADVLKHGYGTRRDIALLFVAMAKAAGFEAGVLPVSSRQTHLFEKDVLSVAQLNTEVVSVQFNGKEVFLDPGTPFCPFGLLRWMNAGTMALRTGKHGGGLMVIPDQAPAKAITSRTAALKLSEDGALSGEISVEFKAGEALERRLDALQSDEAGRAKDLEDEMTGSLPEGATVKLVDSRGWEGSDDPLSARFHVEISAYASLAGKRLLLPGYVFQLKQKFLLPASERKYPVYYSYPFVELDKVSITVPDGFTLENLAQNADATADFARYQNKSVWNAGTLVTQRGLVLGGTYFDLSTYSTLKDFFAKVQAGDGMQSVLRQGATSKQKSN